MKKVLKTIGIFLACFFGISLALLVGVACFLLMPYTYGLSVVVPIIGLFAAALTSLFSK